MCYWLLLCFLGIFQLLFFIFNVNICSIPSMLCVPSQLICILVASKRFLSIFHPIKYSALSYVNIKSRIEHIWLAVFSIISIIGYLCSIFFLENLSDHFKNYKIWTKKEKCIYTLASIGICLGESLIFGEHAFNVVFNNLFVEVGYNKYPLVEWKPLSPWDCGIPIVGFTEDEDEYQDEMKPMSCKGTPKV